MSLMRGGETVSGWPRSPIRSRSGTPRTPIASAELTNPPFPSSLMEPICAHSSDIRAAISKLLWGASFQRAGRLVSSRPRRMSPWQTRRGPCGDAGARMAAWQQRPVFSDGDAGLQSIVLNATRQPITYFLDWFHLSMRLRHIEQAWERMRHLGDLNIYLRYVAVHVPRLRHLLWNGYVRRQREP